MRKISKSTKEKILKDVRSHPAGRVKVAISDIDGILRGKFLHIDKFLSSVESGFGFCDVVMGWDSADLNYDNVEYTGWHTGFPDAPVRIDLSTYRNIPWDDDVPFFLAELVDEEEDHLQICPRGLLQMVAEQAKEMGYKAMLSQEFEWFNFQETPQSIADKSFRDLQTMTPGMFGYSILRSSMKSSFFNDIFDLMKRFDVPLEGLHTETGPGVYEAGIVYDEILEAADKATLFKTGVKEIAYRHGLIASFMAKWSANLPGCSGHIHQSLWNAAGSRNLFYNNNDKNKMSELMKSYVAGVLHCLPELLPMYAPTVNSYKRLVEGAWAPTTLTWGLDNRTTALRVIATSSKSARIENRVAGSDVNPYLAMAASLASGLYGIRKKMKLSQPATKGNGYEDARFGRLPANLLEASEKMRNSRISKELFGKEFVDHFCSTREWEWRNFGKAVTDWELKRYFEII